MEVTSNLPVYHVREVIISRLKTGNSSHFTPLTLPGHCGSSTHKLKDQRRFYKLCVYTPILDRYRSSEQ